MLLGPMLQPLLDSVDIGQSVHLRLVATFFTHKTRDQAAPKPLIAKSLEIVLSQRGVLDMPGANR